MELLEPLFDLLVVVQKAAVRVWQVDSVEAFESPRGRFVSDYAVDGASVPLSGPPVRLVTASGAGKDGGEPVVDFIAGGRKLLTGHLHRLPHATGQRTDLPRIVRGPGTLRRERRLWPEGRRAVAGTTHAGAIKTTRQ